MAGGWKNSSCGFRLIGPGGDSFTAYNLTHTPHLLDIIGLLFSVGVSLTRRGTSTGASTAGGMTPAVRHLLSPACATSGPRTTGVPQLGTCHSCCVNLTQFQGQIIVFCHITTKYCVKTPFWLRVANCFRSIAYTGYRCLSWIRCCMVAFQKCRNVNRTPSSVNYCTICRWNIWILRRFVMLFLLVGLFIS